MARTALKYPRIPLNGVYILGAKSIGGATGDIARTTEGRIENKKFSQYLVPITGTMSAEFDTAVTRTGTKTLKLSATNATGRCHTESNANSLTDTLNFIRVKPSTSYTFNCWVKTNNVGANSSYIRVIEITTVPGFGTQNLTNKLTGTVDWTLCTVTFTTSATTQAVELGFFINTAGVSDAWADVNSMTLVAS